MKPKREVIPCKYCGAPIRFFRNSTTGRWLTVNAIPIAHNGGPDLVVAVDRSYAICTTRALPGETIYLPHWLNNRCPNRTAKLNTESAKSAPSPGEPAALPAHIATGNKASCF